jgi:hypothetical protein
LILSLDNGYIFPKVHYIEEPRSSDVVQRAERVEVLAAVAELEPLAVFIEDPRDKVPNPYTAENCGTRWAPNCHLQHGRAAECYEKVLEFERKVGWTHDWFLRLRPDMQFSSFHPPFGFGDIRGFSRDHSYLPLTRSGEWNDRLSIFPRAHLQVFANVASTCMVHKCLTDEEENEYHCRQDGCICLYNRLLEAAGISIRPIPMSFTVMKFVPLSNASQG